MSTGDWWFIELPFPPSINTYMGKRFKPKLHKEYHQLAAQVGGATVEKTLTGSIEVDYFFQKGDLKRNDLSNFCKSLDDGFTAGGVWGDDSQIDHAHLHRLPSVPNQPKVYVLIREVSPTCGIDQDREAAKLSKRKKK